MANHLKMDFTQPGHNT